MIYIHCLNTEDCNPAKYGDIKIGCILYADDLVIISESDLGMQKCLNTLENYCKKWKIDINVSKSKIMITSKKPVIVSHNFMVGNIIIETVKKYKYLGFFLSYTGSVQYAQDHLAEIERERESCKSMIYFKKWFI